MPNHPQRLKFLDGLRGIAALSVVLFHHYIFIKNATAFPFPHFFEALFSKGYLGVQIFFVLSGFVIAYSMRHASLTGTYLKRFFIKRSIRLDPPYWVSILLMMTATALFSKLIAKQHEPMFEGRQIFANIFYLQDFLDFESLNPVSWTLCLEFQLYLFFACTLGLIFKICKAAHPSEQLKIMRSSYTGMFFSLLLILSLEHQQRLVIPLDLNSWTPKGLFLSYWYSFFMGCVVCWAAIGWINKAWLYVYFSLLFAYVWMSFQSTLTVSLLTALTIHLIARWSDLSKWTCSGIFQYLGKISFSLYLIHWLTASNCIFFLAKRVGEMHLIKVCLIFLFSLSATIMAAHWFYRWIESPCLRWSQSWEKLGAQACEQKPSNFTLSAKSNS